MKHINKAVIAATACMAFSSVAFSSNALAAEVKPAMSAKHAKAATQYRQSIFQLVKSNMGPLGGMAKGALPFDESVIETNAVRLEQLANMMGDYLSVDTREYNMDTGAKDTIWENFSDVETKIAAFKSAAQGLQTAVDAGDESAYRNAIGKIGASCKSCHDDYKKE
ncbi:c-type cytochrome [Alteromonas sp. BMJM2]|uniref:c-type cytochrome n=1 Tax=Alteromonas sp. BMJM2 TaxID=2954241 RepID=UPI0022B3454B|nr:cytochrome c [Alteromonas sp. BMJM2]